MSKGKHFTEEKDNLRELVLKIEDIIDNKKTNTCYIDKKKWPMFYFATGNLSYIYFREILIFTF